MIDENTFSSLKGVTIQMTKVKAYTYGGKQPVKFLGKFTAVMETKKSITAADVYVVKERISGCLLSCKTAQELRLITLNLDTLTDKTSIEKDNIAKRDNQLETLLLSHRKVFTVFGKLKGHKVALNINETIDPVSLKQRKLPFHIRHKVSEALKKLLDDDIIEKIPDNQPTPWVSPIVAIQQENNSIRLCVDMRKPNLAIKRTNFPIPTTAEIDVLLNGACFFSKLDIRQAFHQIELHQICRYITTFTRG